MTGQFRAVIVLSLATLAVSRAASVPGRARAESQPSARCFRLKFLHDSATALLPDRLQWSAADSIARVAWDTTSADARELSRQTRGNARWNRFGRDSIVIRVGFTLVDWAESIRFRMERDSIRGVLVESGRSATTMRPFVGVPDACPVRDHAS